MPEEIKKRYVVRFKRKDIRPNKRDDKITILKNVVNMDPRRITRRDERVLAVHEVGENSTRLAQDPEKIVDINEFSVPLAVVSLSADQAEALRKDENVQWVYEDQPANIRLFEQSEILPFAAADDAPRREFITENVKRMKAPQAWNYKTGYGVKVAVMDTGIDKTHPDLAPNFKGGAAFISGDSSPPGTRNDWSGGGFHGTGCAGFIGAVRGNGQGVVGIAPECFLYDARVFGINGGRAVSNAELTTAYIWAGDNNIDVCNMSFGADHGVRFDRTGDWYPFMRDQDSALTASRAKGTIFVASSGNDGDGGKRSNKLADKSYPAAYNAVASVSAIEDHQVAEFSNSGDSVNFTAPGTNNEGSPNESTGPYGLTCYAGRSSIPGDSKIYRNEYGWFAGTSMAAPHVTGVFALAYAAYKPESCVVAYNGLGTVYNRIGIISRVVGFTADGMPGGPFPMGQDTTVGLGLPNAERAVRMFLNISDEGMAPIPAALGSNPITQTNKVFFT
jgi:subtilisin